MEQFTEKHQVDYLFGNSTGVTAAAYYWPNVDMSNYDEAAFIISTPFLQIATATAAANECIFTAAVYAATAATSTSLTAISSATASFGSTSGGQINKAKSLIVTFNTASTGTTYSINGKQLTIQSTQSVSSAETLGGTALTNATYASALAAYINSTSATFSSMFVATTDLPVGATMLSSNSVYIRPKEVGSTYMSATGYYGATANKGVLVAGDFQAVITVPTEKLGGKRYITIGCNSSGIAAPFHVSLVRKGARFTPENKGLAANTRIGSTTT
jgi:hypothetical protein